MYFTVCFSIIGFSALLILIEKVFLKKDEKPASKKLANKLVNRPASK